MQAAIERFAGALSVLALLVTVGVLVALVRGRVPDWLRELALPTAAVITGVATAGSLWMSEVAGYTPCVLCWYQRIAMYPLPLLAGIAAWRGDRDGARWTVVPLATVGAAVSVWHLLVERVPSLAGPCDPAAPCAVRWVEEFGFLTLPGMALTAFLAAIALALAAGAPRRAPRT